MDPPSRYETTKSYKEAFEKCNSYKDGAVTPHDFANVCRTFKLNYKEVMNHMSSDGHGMYTLHAFMMYMQRQQELPQRNGRISDNYYNDPGFSPPPRPSSGSKNMRHGIYHPSSSTSNPSHSMRRHQHPMSPTTIPQGLNEPAAPFNEADDCTPEELHLTHLRRPPIYTPEHNMSPEDRHTINSRTDHNRIHGHAPAHSTHLPPTSHSSHGYNHDPRIRPGAYSRNTMAAADSPPPSHSSRTHTHYPSRRNRYQDGKSDKGCYNNDSGDDDGGGGLDPYPPTHVHPSSHLSRSHPIKKCKNCDKQKEMYSKQVNEIQEELKLCRNERVRLEEMNEKLRLRKYDTHSADTDQLRLEIESLKQDNIRLRSDCDRQYEEMKKSKKSLKMEKQKFEDQQRVLWRLKEENQKLQVRLMKEDEQSPQFARRPGDEAAEDSSRLPGESNFKRTPIRSTYTCARNEVSRDSCGRNKSLMKRTSSAGNPLDHDEPVKETSKLDGYKHPKTTKTCKSAGTSDIGSFCDNYNFPLPLVTSIPDEQSQVFMVLNEDVSKSVLPESLPKEQELAMIYALQNCHSIQELIKCLLSHGVSMPSDKLSGFQVENEHLKHREEHLLAKLETMTLSFENSKADMTSMYHKAKICEANNTRLRHALKLCQQACEVYEVLLECKNVDPRFCNGSIMNPSTYYGPSTSYDSLDTNTRSPDREGIHRSLTSRVRMLLNQLESNPELQNFLPYGKQHSTLSQTTGTTSGLSSLSGGTDIDITPSDVDRLRQYTQALIRYEKHLVFTLEPLDGLNGLSTVKKPEQLCDSRSSSEHGGREVNDIEEAAHAEELCKVREEKAELKSQIYMMEQEKKRMELEVGRLKNQKIKSDKLVNELKFMNSEEKRKRKRKQRIKGDSAIPSHESGHVMSELSLEYTSALEREKELTRRYEDLFSFLQSNIRDSQETTDELMRFVKELRRANSALVDAFEKSKKRQKDDKRRLKRELVMYMNRVQGNGGIVDDSVSGANTYYQ